MNAESQNPEGASRREKQRAATMEEIRGTARRLLVERGAAAVTVNAVAREIGMSGPALYRYYSSHDRLIQAVIADLYGELTAALGAARHGRQDPATRLLAMCRALRAWAVAHPAEFAWAFATPSTTVHTDSLSLPAALNFEEAFRDEVAALWAQRPFPVPSLGEMDPRLREQLEAYSRTIDGQLPPAAAYVFVWCWTRLYGLLSMEVLRQLDFAYSDLEPVFEDLLREMSARLDIDYTASS